MLYSMISRDRSDVMVNVFRCDRKAFNLITLLDNEKILSTPKFENNFCVFLLFFNWAKKTRKRIRLWEWYERGADILCERKTE